jgi:hypothetical protein
MPSTDQAFVAKVREQSVSRAGLAEALRRVEDTVRTLQQEHQGLCARIEELRSNSNGFEEVDELNADALPWHRLTRDLAEVKAAVEQLREVIITAPDGCSDLDAEPPEQDEPERYPQRKKFWQALLNRPKMKGTRFASVVVRLRAYANFP